MSLKNAMIYTKSHLLHLYRREDVFRKNLKFFLKLFIRHNYICAKKLRISE